MAMAYVTAAIPYIELGSGWVRVEDYTPVPSALWSGWIGTGFIPAITRNHEHDLDWI